MGIRVVSPWVVDWPLMFGNHGRFGPLGQQCSEIVATLVVVSGGIYRAGFAGYVALRAVFPLFLGRSKAISVEESVAALVEDTVA